MGVAIIRSRDDRVVLILAECLNHQRARLLWLLRLAEVMRLLADRLHFAIKRFRLCFPGLFFGAAQKRRHRQSLAANSPLSKDR